MYKVMVIDDEDNLRQALEQLLVSNGYAFCGARDAESGLELLASEHPDLLLLDVMLPGDVYKRQPQAPASSSISITCRTPTTCGVS